ncbi:hypothetical protein GmRootV118_27750 [Variovorax sp. V118]
MARSYRMPDIAVRIPFGTTEPGRIALLRSAGIPLDARGHLLRGFLHERGPARFGADSTCRWFDTAGTASASAAAAPGPVSATQGL